MSVINTGTHPKLLWPGLHAIWGQTYDEHPKEYTDLYDEEDSDKAWEEDVQVTGFGLMQIKSEGGGGSYDTETQGIISRYQHIAWSLGWKVTYEEMRDNLYSEVGQRRAKANAFSVNQTIENIAAFLYNNATSTSFFTTGDGVALLSASHVNPDGSTYSNILSPGADLEEASLEDICIQMMGATNSRGLNISVMPKTLHVPRQEWFNAHRILKSALQSGTANNDINALKVTNAFPGGIKMNHYFTNASRWFVRTNVMNGMRMFWRDRPFVEKDNDFDTKNAKALAYMRLSVGCTDPLGIFGSDGP